MDAGLDRDLAAMQIEGNAVVSTRMKKGLVGHVIYSCLLKSLLLMPFLFFTVLSYFPILDPNYRSVDKWKGVESCPT